MRHLPRGIDQMPLTTFSAMFNQKKVLAFSVIRHCLIAFADADARREAKVVTEAFVPVVVSSSTMINKKTCRKDNMIM